MERCFGDDNEINREYHDERWCRPVHDEKELFAMLCLEGMQAGLSWQTILNKEKDIRKAFDGFDIKKVASYDEADIERLLNDKKIIRNKAKIRCAVVNARAFLKVEEECGSFDSYIWSFTKGKRIIHHLSSFKDLPAQSALSRKVSKDLTKRGFRFVGPTIIYSYLEGIGVIDDHLDGCPFKNLSETGV